MKESSHDTQIGHVNILKITKRMYKILIHHLQCLVMFVMEVVLGFYSK